MAEGGRVYLPTTLGSLAGLLRSGSLSAGLATAVTDDLRASLPGLDDEELELEALLDAAELSLALLAADAEAPRRRVVVAADVPRGSIAPAPDEGVSVVRLSAPVPLDTVASVHVDEPSAEGKVAAGDVEGVDLLWYAPQEIGDVLSG